MMALITKCSLVHRHMIGSLVHTGDRPNYSKRMHPYQPVYLRSFILMLRTGAFPQVMMTLTAIVSRMGALVTELKTTVEQLLDVTLALLGILVSTFIFHLSLDLQDYRLTTLTGV